MKISITILDIMTEKYKCFCVCLSRLHVGVPNLSKGHKCFLDCLSVCPSQHVMLTPSFVVGSCTENKIYCTKTIKNTIITKLLLTAQNLAPMPRGNKHKLPCFQLACGSNSWFHLFHRNSQSPQYHHRPNSYGTIIAYLRAWVRWRIFFWYSNVKGRGENV